MKCQLHNTPRLLFTSVNWQIYDYSGAVFLWEKSNHFNSFLTSDSFTASRCLITTYQMYMSMTVRHRSTGCFIKCRIPGGGSSFRKVPALGFNFRFNLSFPLPRAIYCITSSASAVFPWEYSHRGDSGSMLTGKKEKSMATSSFLSKINSTVLQISHQNKKKWLHQCKIHRKAFYLHCYAY